MTARAPTQSNSQPILRRAALRALESQHANCGLMERAGRAAATWATELRLDNGRPILIVAGPGNNGGDALVAARLLHQRHFDLRVVFTGDAQQLPKDAQAAHAALIKCNVDIHAHIPVDSWSLVIDGLFGVGLTRPIDGALARLVEEMQGAAQDSACPLLALDCPSGLDCDTGQTLGTTVRASHTLSFLALKPGLLTAAGPDHCGVLKVDALGLNLDAENLAANDAGQTIGRDQFASTLSTRPRDSHKGSFGATGILGGAPGMVGAALLAGRAALHMGSGRVYLGLIDAAAPRVDPQQAELMLRSTEALLDAPLTALAAGPGMGDSATANELLERALRRPQALILDADAINLLARSSALRGALKARDMERRTTVLTPHPAEAARLLDIPVHNLQKNRLDAARQLATEYACWLVLKGCGSIVAAPDGRWWINTSGNPGLASAGTGDVLTGMLGGLLAQGFDTGAAIRLAVYLHGAAADQLAQQLGGEVGMTASEVIASARHLLNQWIGESSAPQTHR